jgi:hypothetical protein
MPPTAEPGGDRPQAASFPWPAILVDSLLVGETRPRGSVDSICPDTEKAPPEGRAERLRNSSQSGKITPDRDSTIALTSSPDEAFFRETAKSPGRPYCNGLPGPISSPHGETHFRKRSRLSGRGASLATACAAPDGLRSYRPIGQTLLTGSPPLSFDPHGATRRGPERGSPFRLQLLRNATPVSPHFPSLPAPLGFPPPDVP